VSRPIYGIRTIEDKEKKEVLAGVAFSLTYLFPSIFPGRKPNGMISDHAWGASDCLSAFEVSIEISLSVPGFHKALPFVAALGDIR